MSNKMIDTIDLRSKTAHIEGLGEVKVSPYVKIKGLFDKKNIDDRSFDRGVRLARKRLEVWRNSAAKR